jgi:Acetyltransferase (GNAT) domain
VGEITAVDELAWRELASRAVEPNPFCEPDCLIPAAKHQVYGAEINLVVAERDGRFFACLPVRAVKRWKFPYPIFTSQVRRMNGMGTPLVDPLGNAEAVAQMLRLLREHKRMFKGRIFVLDTSGADGPVSGYMRTASKLLGFPLRAYESWERGKLIRRPDGDYEHLHSTKSRYNLGRQKRLLRELLGEEVRLVDRTNDPDAISDYIRLEASGYKGRDGTAMATVPGEPEYFTEMCERFRATGRIYILGYQTSAELVAMEVWIRGGDGFFLMKISYDERYSRFGPGVLMQTDAIRYFHQTDANWIDTCTSAGNELLMRLYPGRRKMEMLSIVLGRNPLDRLVIWLFVTLRPLHRRIHDRKKATRSL